MTVYLALRAVEPDSDGRLVLPPAWTLAPVPTTPAPTWTAYFPGDPDAVIVTRGASMPDGRALYAILGPKAWLDTLGIAADVAPAREVLRRALAAPGIARDVLKRWRWWRCDVTERDDEGDPVQLDGVIRELCADGVELPAFGSTPWDLDADGAPTTAALATRRVRSRVRPVLAPGGVPWTMAGLDMHTAFEGAEDRGV